MSTETPWGDLVVAGTARLDEVRTRHGNGVEGVEVREGGRRLLVYFIERAPRGVHPANIRIDAPPGGRRVVATEVRRAAQDDPELEDHLLVELDHPGGGGIYRLRLVEPAAGGLPGHRTMRGIDARYDQVQFVFDVDAPLPPIQGAPTGEPAGDYDISYLLRDYEGFRQLMLDRLAVTMPAWTERHVPDSWITLIELLAYVGDDLSYYEDAVATEAYLQTARQRVSVRRHARLVDYRLHEGCDARAWVSVQVTEPVTLPPRRIRFAAAGALLEARPPLLDETAVPASVLAALPQYTPLPARLGPAGRYADITLQPAHNQIRLWSWGELDSHLATGATSAHLVDGSPPADRGQAPDRVLDLAIGDALILEETHDPLTQGRGPADPTHRQAVRLTEVHRTLDRLYRQPLLEVRWASEDALTFDLAVTAGGHAVGQATGNVVLVGHGIAVSEPVQPGNRRLTRAELTFSTPFPDPALVARHQARVLRGLYRSWRREVGEWRTAAERGTPLSRQQLELLERQLGAELLSEVGLGEPFRGGEERREEHARREATALEELLARAGRVLARRRRRLDVLATIAEARGPLEHVLIEELRDDWGQELTAGLAAGRPGSWGPASASDAQDPRAALPVLELADSTGNVWRPAADLVGAAPDARVVVAEVDDQGIAGLRINGADETTSFTASYWVGNGVAGNAEAETINAVVWLAAPTGTDDDGSEPSNPPVAIAAVRNPLPAAGGVEPEDIIAAKAAIPGSFLQSQPRALTVADYVSLANAVEGVRRAAAELRFSGSLTVVDVAIQPTLGEDPHPDLLGTVKHALEQARRINHVLRVTAPRYRALLLELHVAIAPSTIRVDVASRLARMLGSGWLPDGTAALFNPQRLSFGQTVYASPIVAAVHGAADVQAVTLTGLGFVGQPPGSGGPTGALTLKALELPRLDNDPTHPEHGYALVTIEGGR